jgi:hypothetical protein
MSYPDFIIIGSAKSGTTTLYDYLARHDGICMSRPKEPEVLALARAEDERTQYEKLFAHRKPGQILGEASTIYTRYPNYPGVPERMHRLMPDVKLIYIVREPVERTYADYAMVQRFWMNTKQVDRVTCTFEEALATTDNHLGSILPASDYALQIEQYLRYFPREQMLLLLMSDLIKNPAEVLSRVCEFLGVPSIYDARSLEHIKSNTRDGYESGIRANKVADWLGRMPMARMSKNVVPHSVRRWVYKRLSATELGDKLADGNLVKPLGDETRARLREHFREPVKRFEALLGRDLSSWLVPESRAEVAAVGANERGRSS